MTTRSLTEVFSLLRNNAFSNRNIYSDQGSSDRLALVASNDDIELDTVPPSWCSIVEDCQCTIVRLKIKLTTLGDLYSKAISRPAFDDSTQDEHQIQHLSDEITRIYNGLYKNIGLIYKDSSDSESQLEKKLVNSVSQALVADIQSLYSEFKSIRNNYKNKLKTREERSNAYFETNLYEENNYEEDSTFVWGAQQLAEDRIKECLSREKDVENIVNSILSLRDIYSELADLVVNQGTVLDRIDYQIETTQCQVRQATVQLEKAHRYHRTNRKMMCILLLAVVTTVLTVILIITKI